MKELLPGLKGIAGWLGLLLLFLFLNCPPARAQNTSNKGTDFWVAYTGHVSGQDPNINNQPQLKLYLTSDVNTSGLVEVPGQNFSLPFTITANTITIVQVPNAQAYVGSSEVIENRGIHVTALKPIVVYSHIYRNAQSGATLVLPTNTLGRLYYSINYDQVASTFNNQGAYTAKNVSQFTIVALEDNTTLEITPTQLTLSGKPAGVKFSPPRTLMKGEVFQVQSQTDLTGSKIESVSSATGTCKKISVFSGSTFTRINKGCPAAGTGDNLYQQLYPYSAWGKNFVTAPFMSRTSGDVYRVLTGPDNTVVTINGTAVNVPGNSFHEFQTLTANSIRADKPITLAQYPKTLICDGNNGDPELIILAPIEQTLNNITLYSSNQFNIAGNYINIVMKTANTASFRLDGAPVTFVPVAADPTYSYSQNMVQEGTHGLVADSGFTAIVYGFGNPESYGYSAGANVRDLTKFITPMPAAGPGFVSGCEGATVSFGITLPYNPTSMVWDYGDGSTYQETDLSKRVSPVHTYPTQGTYIIKLTAGKPVSNDCDTQDEVTFDFVVNVNPKADFSFTDFCAKNPTTFKDLSSVGSGSLAKWEWEFEPGKKSTLQNPTYTFANPGDYRVKLRVITNGGCTDTLSKKITIYPLPKPAFQATTVCETYGTNFTDASTIASGTISKWEWNFGDQTPMVTDRHPGHTYAKPGTYQVRLRLTSDLGCTDSLSQQVTVHPKPQVAYQLPNICLKDVATFANKSTILTGTLTYKWYFGDGGTSTAANPVHKYTAEGIYKVKLVATSDKGCKDSLTTDYLVSGAEPEPEFQAANFCRKDSVSFRDASTIAFGKIFKWKWHFGDGNTSTLQNPKHLYANPGTYTVKMIAYSGEICRDSVSKTITVVPSPDAVFTLANVCLGEAVPLTEGSALAGGSISSYRWDFGDGQTATGRQPTHVYAASGTYNIILTVTGSNGCTDRMVKPVVIYPKPVPTFNATNFCEKDAVAFTDQSGVSSGTLAAWKWEFGNGVTDTRQNPTYTYPAPGTYNVRLTVTTDRGCQESVVKTITVSALPQAQAGPDQVKLCGMTTFALQGNVPPAGQGTWTIVGGSGGTIGQVNQPNAVFSGKMNELYTLRWTVRNAPCPDATDEVQIQFNPIPAVEAGPGAVLVEGESFQLTGSGTGTFSWSPAGGLSNTGIANPVATPEQTTVYKLTVTTPVGCTATDTVRVKVLARLKIPNAFSPNNDGVNDTWVIGGIQDHPGTTIEIFDRWGGRVYTGGYNTPWDGKRNGTSLPMGTYFYIINQNNGRKPFSGPISIIK